MKGRDLREVLEGEEPRACKGVGFKGVGLRLLYIRL